MSNCEQTEQIAGNIQISDFSPEIELFTSEDKGYQADKYFFTYHLQNDEQFEQAFMNLEGLADICDKYVWGEEYGKKKGKPHIQGCFILSSKMRWKTIEKHYFVNPCPYGKKLKNWDRAFKYCCKELNRIESNCKLPIPLKIISDLYPYQKEVVDMLKKDPNDRDIIWIYGDYNIGKTQLCKYLIFNKIAFGPLEGEKRHILSVIAQNINETAFIFYLTKAESEYQKCSFFEILEKVKDGLFMSHFGTDNTDPVIMNSPHILVFANTRPNWERTEMDPERFFVYRILDKCLEEDEE